MFDFTDEDRLDEINRRIRRRVQVRNGQLADKTASVLIGQIEVLLGRIEDAIDRGVDFPKKTRRIRRGRAASSKNCGYSYFPIVAR